MDENNILPYAAAASTPSMARTNNTEITTFLVLASLRFLSVTVTCIFWRFAMVAATLKDKNLDKRVGKFKLSTIM